MHAGQVMMEALTPKKSYAAAERHKQALQDMEEYFGVKGLLAGSATVTYKRHNTRVHQAIQAAAAGHNTGRPACIVVVHTQPPCEACLCILLCMKTTALLYDLCHQHVHGPQKIRRIYMNIQT